MPREPLYPVIEYPKGLELSVEGLGGVFRNVNDNFWDIYSALDTVDAVEGAGTGYIIRTGPGAYIARSIAGTVNQVNVANGSGVGGQTVLSTPQDIHTGASPTFSALTLSSFTGKQLLYSTAAKLIGELGAATDGQIPIGSTGNAPVLATITAGANISVTNGAGAITLAVTGIPLVAFKTISTPSGTSPVADATDDTLTFTAGANITITGDSATDTVAIAVTGLPLVAFKTIAVSGSTDIVADTAEDTLTIATSSSAITLATDSATDTLTIGFIPGVTLGDLIIGDATPAWVRKQGNSLAVKMYLQQTGTGLASAAPVWDTIAAADLPAHNLLGTQHGDTNAQTVSRGSIVYGNSTPKWDELVIGAAKTWLHSDGTDAAWAAIPPRGGTLFRQTAETAVAGTNPATSVVTMTNLNTTFVIIGAVAVVTLDQFANIRLIWRGNNSGAQVGTISVELLMDGTTSLVTATTTSTSIATRTASAAISQTGDHYIYARVKSSVATDDPQFNFIGFELY